MLSVSSRGFEFVRDLNTFFSLRSRAFRDCIRNTAVVFAANEETEVLLTPYRQGRPLVRLPIASISSEMVERFRRPDPAPTTGPLRLFAGGNMEGRKGVSLALKALAIVAKAGVDFRYVVAGGGPEIPSLKILCRRLGLDHLVEFHSGYSGSDYVAALQAADIYFLPSFRESTPVTLLEAYLAGCYPVVADTSAQGEIVRLAGGTAVPTTDIDPLISGLATALMDCEAKRRELPSQVAESQKRLIAYFDSARYDSTVKEAYRVAFDDRTRSNH